MKILGALLTCLFLASSALAGPWTMLKTVELSPASTSVTIDIGEKLGKIDNLRFHIEDQTVHFKTLTAIPIKGEPIPLRVPNVLKSGESSGLVNIPGMSTTLKSVKFEYAITSGISAPAKLTLRVKPD